MMTNIVLLTNVEVFGSVVKHGLECLECSQSKLKLRRKRKNLR